MAKHKHDEDNQKESKSSDKKSFFNIISGFFSNKYGYAALILFLVLVSMFFSVYYRSYTATLPVTEDWARNSAINSIRSNIASQINKQYPNLPDTNKNQLIDEQVALVFEQQGSDIEEQIQATSDYFKSKLQDDSGQTYLLAIDPYQHLRRAENILENGHIGDELRDGKPFNNHMFAPIGVFINKEFHVYVIYYLYRIMSVFNPGISMLAAAFWVPALISCLSVIPAFFIAKKRAGIFGAFIAAMIVAVHPVFLGRTPAGFSDTDAYVVFFALMVIWFFSEAFEAKKYVWISILSVISGFFVGLFAFSWKGWWYIFDLIVGMLIIYAGYKILKFLINKETHLILKDQALRKSLVILLVFVISSMVFLPLVSNNNISDAFEQPLSYMGLFGSGSEIKAAANANYWPNIKTTVAELNPSTIPKTITQIGGKLLFFMAMFGIVLSMVKTYDLRKKDYYFLGISIVFLFLLLSDSLINMNPIIYLSLFLLPLIAGLLLLLKDDREVDFKYAILLALWFVGAIFVSTKGTRFVLLLVPAFAIAMGISLGLIHRLFTNLISKEFKIPKIVASIGLIILLALFLVAPIKAAHRTALYEVPSMNDAWWESLSKINNESQPDAIINSWWDFGHWFKYVGDRAVTVDGAGQDHRLAHFMGTVLISDNEEQALNTLRMLDCGSVESYESILTDTGDIMLSVRSIKEIMMQTEEDARKTLEDAGMSQEGIDKTLNYVFCNPPENYFITSEDMVGKAGVWAHFGSWDFERSFIYLNSKGKTEKQAVPIIMEELGLTEEKASEYYYQVQALSSETEANSWIAPWPNYFTQNWVGCKKQGEVLEETAINGSNVTSIVVSKKGLVVCGINTVVSQSQQSKTVIEAIVFNLDNPKNSSLLVGSYDASSGYKLGSGNAKPASFLLIKEEGIEKVPIEGTTFPYDVLLDLENNKALITDPALSESLFTKLFYLDGKYTEHFEKFSDLTGVDGQRIIVWKVKWPESFSQN